MSEQTQESARGTEQSASEQQTTTEENTNQRAQGNTASSQALIDELNDLAAKFAEAVDVAWKSEQRKRLEEDLKTGVTSVAESLEQHLKEFSRREDTRKFLDRAEDVADKVRSSKVSHEIATALTQGLRTLSDQLDKLSQDLRERDATARAGRQTGTSATGTAADSGAASEAAQDDSQDIPIQRS